ncbi:hypothetical protein [Leuconostoc mesenteroides]|uniref:hypothetical protein n=1 Tax=Leuconostoc mesenteroides TaxID=1245 RepID=UPI002360CD32|nr:hypothetical protein [Leuconostoc mesenteroides]
MGLSPKKELQHRNQSWSDIDAKLQAAINYVGDTATISLNDYPSLNKAEVIAEAEKNNYSVSDKENGYLEFS